MRAQVDPLTRARDPGNQRLDELVSRANQRAFRLYQTMGMQEVLAFPVFVWEAS